MAAVERLHVLHHSADYIFHFLWDLWDQFGLFENRALLICTLDGESSVANFILFPKAIFFFCLFYYTTAGVSAVWRR